MAKEQRVPTAVAEQVRELVEALRAAPEMVRFRAAEEQFRTDAELDRMRLGLRFSFQNLQRMDREGRHDPRLFQEVRETQARLLRHPLVVEFSTARAAAQDLLREANGAMTAILGVDVGATGGRAGAC